MLDFGLTDNHPANAAVTATENEMKRWYRPRRESRKSLLAYQVWLNQHAETLEMEISALGDQVRDRQMLLDDPEGAIQRGINERYRRDLRERELEHHAQWDIEVAVHRRHAAMWMRWCAASVLDDPEMKAKVEALPLEPENPEMTDTLSPPVAEPPRGDA